MNKSTFIDTLGGLLASLNKDEFDRFISYYEEMIEDYKENGFTEQEVIKKIGSPQTIANHILTEQGTMYKEPSIKNKKYNRILLILGFPLWGSLVLTVALLILSFYLIIWCLPFTTAVSSIAFGVAAIMSIIGSPFMMVDMLDVGVVQLGVGVTAMGLSILLGYLTIYLSNYFLQVTKRLTAKTLRSVNEKVVNVW